MSAVTKGVAFLNVVTRLAAPVAHLAVILAPGMHGMVADCDLSPSSSFAFEVGGLVHVTIDATAYVDNGIGGSESF